MPRPSCARASSRASGQQTRKTSSKAAEKPRARPSLKSSRASTAQKSSGAVQSNGSRKRPSSASAAPAQKCRKKPATVASSVEQVKRKHMCKSIISALSNADELNPRLRDMLACLADLTLGQDNVVPSACTEAAVTMVREGLCSAERKLKQDLAVAEARLQEVLVELEARASDVDNAEATQAELRRTVADYKVEIKESTKAIQTCTEGLKAVQDEQKCIHDKLEQAAMKVDQLRSLDEDLYQPLKVAPPPGPHCRKHVNRICKMGKEFGFENSLLEQIPKVLQKGLDRRRTVDNMVMERMETEFSKEYVKLQDTLQHEQVTFQKCGEAMKDAQSILNDSVQAHKSHAKALTKAETMLSQSKTDLPKARQGVRKVQTMWDKAVRELDLAEARLETFRSGPLSDFKQLQDGLQLASVPAAEAVEVMPAEPGLKQGESAKVGQGVALAPGSPISADLAVHASAVAAPECTEEHVIDACPALPSSLPATAAAAALTVTGIPTACASIFQGSESTESAFAEMPATIAQVPVVDTAAYADTTLAWAATVKDIDG